jgi:hypothetical protein
MHSPVGASLLAIATAATPVNRRLVPRLPLRRPRLNHIQNRAALAHQQMNRAGHPRQITIGDALEVKAGKGVGQIAHDHKPVHRTGGHVAEFSVGIDEEHRGFGVVGVDGEIARHYLVGHKVHSKEGSGAVFDRPRSSQSYLRTETIKVAPNGRNQSFCRTFRYFLYAALDFHTSHKKPLTLALSQRERGLIGGCSGATNDRSHAPRGNAARDALRPTQSRTRSVR